MTKIRILLLAAALGTALAACGPKEPVVDPDLIYTQVAATVAVQMIHTQVAATMAAGAAQTAQAQATPIPPASATPLPVVATPAPPTPAVDLPSAPNTATPEDSTEDEVLDRAALTYQWPVDGQQFNPGSCFDAVWTFQNTGPTTWNSNYSIRWLGYGQRYKAANSYPFSTYADNQKVATGEVVTITAPGLCAPAGEGSHIGPFCLYNSRTDQGLPDQCIFSTTIEVYIGPE
jgi:hypothetical protein